MTISLSQFSVSSSIINVFQNGLRRGSERLPHDPTKHYAYVEHPTEGWRVYLRSVVFLHELPLSDTQTYDPLKFIVVKRRGAHMTTAAWEPPKGQMEGKDLLGVSGKEQPLLNILAINARRETFEEAHIDDFEKFTYTGKVFQGREKNYPPNTYFQYHIFQGFLSPRQIQQSFSTFDWIRRHRDEFKKWSKDRREKDAVSWFNPRITRLNPRWTPAIVAIYLKQFT